MEIRYLYTIARNLCVDEFRKQKTEALPKDISDKEDFSEAVIENIQIRNALMKLTIPYLLSSILSMELERTAFGRKYGLSCMAISAGVSVLMFVLQNERNLYAEAYRGLWYLSTIILMLIEWFEIKKMFQMEEYAWS